MNSTEDSPHRPIAETDLYREEQRRQALFNQHGIPDNPIGRTVRIFLADHGVPTDLYVTTITGYSLDGRRVRVHLQQNELADTAFRQLCALETADPDDELGQTRWVGLTRVTKVTRNQRMLQALMHDVMRLAWSYREEVIEKTLVDEMEDRIAHASMWDERQLKGSFAEEFEHIFAKHGTNYEAEIAAEREEHIWHEVIPFPVHVLFD